MLLPGLCLERELGFSHLPPMAWLVLALSHSLNSATLFYWYFSPCVVGNFCTIFKSFPLPCVRKSLFHRKNVYREGDRPGVAHCVWLWILFLIPQKNFKEKRDFFLSEIGNKSPMTTGKLVKTNLSSRRRKLMVASTNCGK